MSETDAPVIIAELLGRGYRQLPGLPPGQQVDLVGAQATGAGVGTDGHEGLRLRHDMPGALKRPAHGRGDGPGDQ